LSKKEETKCIKRCLLVVLVGLPGAGKSIIGEVAQERGYVRVTMGDVIREELSRRGLDLTRENMLRLARELRKTFGNDIVARLTVKKIEKMFSMISDNVLKLLIDGVRSPREYEYFKNFASKAPSAKTIILAVHASPKTRFKRLVERGRVDDPHTWEEFCERDKEELGFGIGEVIALADYMIINERKSIEDLKREANELFELIEGEYFEDTG